MQAKAYLSLSEGTVIRRTAGKQPAGFWGDAKGTLLGRGARVSSSARLVPPVIVREGAVIGENAIVVGPTIIGPNGQVEPDALVAQSVVLPGAVVPRGCVLRQQVFRTGDSTEQHSDSDTALAAAEIPSEVGSQWSIPPTRVFVPDRPRKRRINLVIKRIIDTVASASALIVLSPFLLLIGLLIKLDSRGPVLFGHPRERRGGKEFRCWKFRTMVPDADSRQRDLFKSNLVDGPQFKMVDDPRVTRVGRWLRATNLDELPQLINVLLGQMSLVGPRPSPFRENQICVAWRHARLSVPPGITGLWQICRAPDRSQGDFHEWIYYDLAYVRHFSLWLDLRILLATLITAGGNRRVPIRWLIGDFDDHNDPPRHLAA
jgi:lipopolysaccharide/colanic/teichoic acid biosynthesis glycosyltransferase/carbonic anhydrase/acetyltransferase-like protein (isoleucine patch superfamily)